MGVYRCPNGLKPLLGVNVKYIITTSKFMADNSQIYTDYFTLCCYLKIINK
jgi:hypothetical protein